MFRDRLEIGKLREEEILTALRVRGWTADFYGQAMLTEVMRDVLRNVEVFLRWSADILAVRSKTVFLVDAKQGRTDTPNYCIEHRAVESAIREKELAPVAIVWPDWRVSQAQEVADAPWDEGPRSCGRTPYRLIPKDKIATVSFDDIFGEEL